ncbi:DUF535 family protein [Helicobacter gastrofelis]|uniref:DUF535 family protein n=1 Tax=Helicobacter gastrofelis TaxID=2849642 RepID=UPI0021A79508|nr:DUF535 family protein [Helicobacter sp. NHP19-012]
MHHPQSHLLIGGVQGKLGLEQEHIRFLDKYCCCQPGLFLIELQIVLTRVLGLDKTLGIPNAGQIAYAKYGELARNYDDLFMKRGADLLEIEGRTYYNLPHTQKDISHYPQKRRAIHRKRLKLLSEMEDNLKKLIRHG